MSFPYQNHVHFHLNLFAILKNTQNGVFVRLCPCRQFQYESKSCACSPSLSAVFVLPAIRFVQAQELLGHQGGR
ncbi:hypothetical protein OUZ56_019260 [Daphnia magna]|uniref:Uncharacterized protein n=1 Tax=Daphnia magna TaxID=35525 RepID=A0ABQ9ZB84_9CRUS|nr:hypothetical protein OUZ56_019260 [Daphnia magna]